MLKMSQVSLRQPEQQRRRDGDGERNKQRVGGGEKGHLSQAPVKLNPLNESGGSWGRSFNLHPPKWAASQPGSQDAHFALH